MLRFLFDSNTSSERADTKALYTRFITSQEQACLGVAECTSDIHTTISALEEQWSLSPTSNFGKELHTIFELLTAESDLFETLQVATDVFIDDVVLDAENRARMTRKISLNEHAQSNRALVRETLHIIGSTLLDHLPETIFGDTQDEHQVFNVRLLDVLDEPLKVLSHITHVFYLPEIQNTALFYHLRKHIEENLLHIESNVRKNAQPKDLERDHTIEEIITLYLQNTCLESLFELRVPFVIPQSVRFEHMHLVAGSGHGKTQTLQYMIARDLPRVASGDMGFAVIDSQGDLINQILACKDICDLEDRVLLIDPNDIAHPPALNMFDVGLARSEDADPVEREKIINGTIDLYSYIFSSLLGAELTQKQGVIFTYLARLMLVIPGANIYTLRELVEVRNLQSDGERFQEHIARLDPSSRHFFEKQFFTSTFGATRQQVLTRLWGVLSNSVFERMFSATQSKIDLFEAMNEGKIVLINTAKDLLKSEGCSIFGRFFIAMIAQAALSRSVLPVGDRKPFFVTIDEAHDYFDDKIEDIANQARKFNVALTLSHQNLDQASVKLRASIMSSTSIKFAGGVSAKDAQVLAQNMHTKPDHILRAKKRKNHTQFACYVRNHTPSPILIDIPFGTLESLPQSTPEDREHLIENNRKRVCQVANYEVDSAQQMIVEPTDEEALVKQVPVQAGKGGEEHKALQKKIADTAIANGFEARIEEHIGEGRHIDVVLYSGVRKIACEISISTTVSHEISNVEKCLDAGFSEVWVIADNARWRNSFSKEIQKREISHGVMVLDSKAVLGGIAQLEHQPQKNTVINGRTIDASFEGIADHKKERHEIVVAKLFSSD